MRTIFEQTRQATQLDINVIGFIHDLTDYHYTNGQGITEVRLAELCNITRRTVRKIVERYNFNKLLNIDYTLKIKVINGRYRVIKGDLVKEVLQYHKNNFHEYIMKYNIMSEALGEVNIMSKTIAELMEVE